MESTTEYGRRWRKVAGAFTDRVQAVPDEAWDSPAPPDGWVARDVVAHMVEWMPAMIFDGAGLERPDIPSAEEDPVGAWSALDAAMLGALDDPAVASIEFEMRMGRFSVGQAIDMFCTGDVLLHTWDLARATGLDETLDPDEVHAALVGMEPMDEVLRASGHYGPKVVVPDDADEQTRLIAFIGRIP